MSELLRNFDPSVINQLKNAYENKVTIENLKGVSLYHEPFTHCVINDLVSSDKFVNDLNKELKSKLKYKQKNNDLYKFAQTADLAKNKLENLSEFRDKFLYGSFLEFLKSITGIELYSDKIDVTSSKYEFSDYLLCHDDNIYNTDKQFGRRIAFIYYLVPEDWNSDGSDGGNLDLFKVNDSLEPIEIAKSLIPKRNNLAFFEVSDKSFHQVSEILAKSKTRFSINGWFHGPLNTRQTRPPEILPEPFNYGNVDPDLFFDWVTEKYLKPTNQTDIQLRFSSSSEIKLDKFFHNDKYEQVSEALNSDEIKWIKKGPADKRNYDIAEYESLPQILKDLVKVLTSDFMGLSLSNMTGLSLHESIPKSKQAEYEEESSFDEDDEDEEEEDNEEEDNQDGEDLESLDESESDETSDENPYIQLENNKRKINLDDGSEPCTSSSLNGIQNLNKKLKSNIDQPCSSNSMNQDTDKELNTIESHPDRTDKPKCYFEVRKWKQGSYTLVRDDDYEIKKEALDLMVFFKTNSWSIECGGNISYIARDEDNELLTVNPEENCVALVFRDEETLRFTKFVNSNINKIKNNGSFFEIYVVYYE